MDFTQGDEARVVLNLETADSLFLRKSLSAFYCALGAGFSDLYNIVPMLALWD
jgi:hypothetical protein